MIDNNDEPRVSVIIASRGHPRSLKEAVESIWQSNRLHAEGLVVDKISVPNPWLSPTGGPPGRCSRYFRRAVPSDSQARNYEATVPKAKVYDQALRNEHLAVGRNYGKGQSAFGASPFKRSEETPTNISRLHFVGFGLIGAKRRATRPSSSHLILE